MKKGLDFFLPEGIDKDISVIEVGPFIETGLAKEINKFLETDIKQLTKIETYILVNQDSKGIEKILTGKPFVDPITHKASLNRPLIYNLNIDFDYVLQSMLNPGTSDMYGDTALRQTLLALGKEFTQGDIGFNSKQYFLKGKLKPNQLEEVSAFLANPDLNTRLILSKNEYKAGKQIQAPIVVLKPETIVKEYDILNMTDQELEELSNTRKLAATLEEMQQFRDMYKGKKFLRDREKAGLSNKATDVELEIWFGLRSEHCFHKELNAHITIEDKVQDQIFKKAYYKGWLKKQDDKYILEDGLFKTFIEKPAKAIHQKLENRGKNWIADMFRDNAGTVLYNKDYMFCIKYETHNSPTNKEPVQGAKTGIDGVNRDIFGNMLGTFEAIANFFGYFMGYPDYKGWLPKGVKHPYVLLKGGTQGVREGGNESQITTMGGVCGFDPRYLAKCLLVAGTVGFSPVKSPKGISYLEKHPSVGDLVFVSGQPVGRDGIHGATESSLSASAYISLGHVQADFSFIQAKMKEWILDCARDNLYTTIGDCGAMGISVMLELAGETGGLEADLAKHPKKYKGIQPWEVGCSETQDRMVEGVSPKNEQEIKKRAELHDVELTKLGKFTDSGYANLKWEGKTIALIDLEKLSNKEPRKRMHATWNNKQQEEPEIRGDYTFTESLCLVMEQPDVASKEWFFRQKDSSVKGATIQGPLIGLNQEVEADATIQKPVETQGKDYGAIAYALGINPKLSDLDAYYSAQKSFVDMVGKIIAVGGALPDMKKPKWDAWAVCGNYCQPNSESKTTLSKENGEHNLASFVREGIGIRDAIERLNIPVISGKDSMKCSCIYEVEDSFKLQDVPLDLRRHITMGEKEVTVKDEETGKEHQEMRKHIEIHDPDTYLASCAVKIKDYRKCVDSAFKQGGDLIYIIGTTKEHLGASQYLSAIGYKEDGAPKLGGEVPKVDFEEFIENCDAVHKAIDNELVASCSYIHNGGLLTAIAKAAIAGELGADINIENLIYPGGMDIGDILYCEEESNPYLYSETPGRFIVTIAYKDKREFEELLESTPYFLLGDVKLKQEILIRSPEALELISLEKVKQSYQKPLRFDLDIAKNG